MQTSGCGRNVSQETVHATGPRVAASPCIIGDANHEEG